MAGAKASVAMILTQFHEVILSTAQDPCPWYEFENDLFKITTTFHKFQWIKMVVFALFFFPLMSISQITCEVCEQMKMSLI